MPRIFCPRCRRKATGIGPVMDVFIDGLRVALATMFRCKRCDTTFYVKGSYPEATNKLCE